MKLHVISGIFVLGIFLHCTNICIFCLSKQSNTYTLQRACLTNKKDGWWQNLSIAFFLPGEIFLAGGL